MTEGKAFVTVKMGGITYMHMSVVNLVLASMIEARPFAPIAQQGELEIFVDGQKQAIERANDGEE